MTYAAPVFVRARFLNATTGEIKEQTVFMGDFPMMTDRGTFIVNGTERVVVSASSSARRASSSSPAATPRPSSPGPSTPTGVSGSSSTSRPSRARTSPPAAASPASAASPCSSCCAPSATATRPSWTASCATSTSSRGSGRRSATWRPTREEALLEIYKRARPGEPLSAEAARVYFENAFFNPKRYDLTRVGRYKLNRKLGPEIDRLSRPVRRSRSRSPRRTSGAQPVGDPGLGHLHAAPGPAHGRRRVDLPHRRPGPLRQPAHPLGRRADPEPGAGRAVPHGAGRPRAHDHPGRRGHHAPDPDQHPPGRGRGEGVLRHLASCRQFMDQNNPLSGLAHKRRLSALGPGGLSRERAGFEVRDVHTSHYGRMCPIETPEGPNIGLIGALATYARVNEYGFIETPVPHRRRRQGDRRGQLPGRRRGGGARHRPGQRRRSTPTAASPRSASWCAAARKGPACAWARSTTSYGTTSEIDFVPPSEVDLMDVSPKQIVSVSTALIPFVEHDDANRALMGANMQKQAVPLVVPEAPYIGTGVEARAARDAGDVIAGRGRRHRDRDQRRLRSPSSTRRARRTASARALGRKVYRLSKFRRSNQNTCINHRTLVDEGQSVAAGDLLADGPVDPQRRAGAGQEPARRLHAVGGLQLRGRHHPLGAPGARRRADLDPHRGARGRRPRHQAGRRGDHPGHPEPLRGDPGRPRRPRHHPRRRRGGAGRRPGRQGHPQG